MGELVMNNEHRKMLECAARAAGIEPCRMNDDENALLLIGVQDEWNPLTSDEDAFRLMSRLHIQVTPYSHRTTCSAVGINAVSIFHEKDSDGAAGRREGITLAAACLGGYDG